MNKRIIKGISLILSIAMVFTMVPTGTAFAASNMANIQNNISLEDETEPVPSVSEEPSPAPEPSSTDQTEPAPEPSHIIQPEPLQSNEPPLSGPANIQDQTESKLDEQQDKKYKEQAEKENKPVQVNELCDEYTTVFQNPDGTKTAYVFGTKVRFKDENGKLVDIDNQLVEASTDKKLEGYAYKNKTSLVDVCLPDNMISDTPVVIEYDKYKIGIIPVIDDDLKKNIDKNLEKMKDEGSNATILEPKTETVECSGI